MVQSVKRWFEWVPGWIPICISIFGAALWVGQYTQRIEDRLNSLEKQMIDVQEYMRSKHTSLKTYPDAKNSPYNDDNTAFEPLQ